MQERCTCGALLPEDARFCHKCGKPQYEEDLARLGEQTVAAPPPQPVTPPSTATARISFGNLRAVIITMAVAAVSLVALCLVSLVAPLLVPIVLCSAGFVAVKFYRSSSHELLSPGSGAFLGLMTGLWLFLVVAVCVALASIYVSSPDGREMLKAAMPKMPEVAKLVDDPHQFLVTMVESLVPTFFIATVSAAFGGLLAVRMSPRSR